MIILQLAVQICSRPKSRFTLGENVNQEDLKAYLQELVSKVPTENYIERRFALAKEDGHLSQDFDYFKSSLPRDRQPELAEVLEQKQLLVLAEPGGGKSIVARAAVREFAKRSFTLPVFVELQGYRGNLAELISSATPAWALEPDAAVDGQILKRALVLDGLDEVPVDFQQTFFREVSSLLTGDSKNTFFLTSRQAFYVSHRKALPPVSGLFHLCDFSDEDIQKYVESQGANFRDFQSAAKHADAEEEMRNPFLLSVLVERFLKTGGFSDRRWENLSYLVDQLISSRPRVAHYQQRRALRFIAVAMETYARNELSEDEAVAIIKQSMNLSDEQAVRILNELYCSILKRTKDGLAFQLASHGEYLAAEALSDASMDRIRELAFMDYHTPNESWQNAVSYLAEMNDSVRRFFTKNHPLWVLTSSPSMFSNEQKNTIVREVLRKLENHGQFALDRPHLNMRKMARFVTDEMQKELLLDLESPNDVVLGNALALLGILKKPEVVPIALSKALDRSSNLGLRYAGVVALVNAGSPKEVPAILSGLDKGDPGYLNILDAACSLADETQFELVFPLMFAENAMLSSTFYHFRTLRSRDALVNTLHYFRQHIQQLNSMRAGGYVEPILQLLPQYFDEEIAEIVAGLLVAMEEARMYPDRSGPVATLFDTARGADEEGWIFKDYIELTAGITGTEEQRFFFVDEIVASLLNLGAAEWLVEKGATDTIKRFAGYVRGPVRELLKPHSAGLMESQEAWATKHRDEEKERNQSRQREVESLQAAVRQRESLDEVLVAVVRLKEEHFPELDETRKSWMAQQISARLVELNLAESVQWKGSTLWLPTQLEPLLAVVSHYQLSLHPDSPLVDALTGWDSGPIPKYYRKHGFSDEAKRSFEERFEGPLSPQGHEGLVRFLHETDLWSDRIEARLNAAIRNSEVQGHIQVLALEVLGRHSLNDSVLEDLASAAENPEVKEYAFQALVERQHRPTIERCLSQLLSSDAELSAAETERYGRSPLDWIAKIRDTFAWDKLEKLRGMALQKNQHMVAGLLTDTLAKIDRAATANLVYRQIELAPPAWRHIQQAQGIRLETEARIEKAKSAPLARVLEKLRGATSLNLLLVFCEGSTDIPVFKALLDQVRDLSDQVKFDFVGGWGQLPQKDPSLFMLGCKGAIVVMDGDEGRHLRKRNRPLTTLAKREKARLAASGVELFVLNRYGIENYFPKSALENVLGRDLRQFFPLAEDISVSDQMSEDFRSWMFRGKRFLARLLRMGLPSSKRSIYAKSRNRDVAQQISLASDLGGTDLYEILHHISARAQELQDT
jgi:hypothetical protein